MMLEVFGLLSRGARMRGAGAWRGLAATGRARVILRPKALLTNHDTCIPEEGTKPAMGHRIADMRRRSNMDTAEHSDLHSISL